jgi:hypothetical protein
MKEIKGNLFDQKVDIVWITTNGSVKDDGRAVMGCGCAADAELLFPGLALQLGTWIQTIGNHFHYLQYFPERQYTVAAFPVKHQWFDEKADLKLIERSCKDLVESLADGLTVALPKIGCGAGKLEWEEIKPVLEKYFKDDRFIIVDFNV